MAINTINKDFSMNTHHDERIDGKFIGVTEGDLSATERRGLGGALLTSTGVHSPATSEPDPLESFDSKYNGAIKQLIDSTPGLSREDQVALTETSFKAQDRITKHEVPPVSASNHVSQPR